MVEAFRPAGIQISSAMLDLISLPLYKDAMDLVTNLMAFYYYGWHDNDVNKWFIKEYQASTGLRQPTHRGRHGRSASYVEALKKTDGIRTPRCSSAPWRA